MANAMIDDKYIPTATTTTTSTMSFAHHHHHHHIANSNSILSSNTNAISSNIINDSNNNNATASSTSSSSKHHLLRQQHQHHNNTSSRNLESRDASSSSASNANANANSNSNTTNAVTPSSTNTNTTSSTSVTISPSTQRKYKAVNFDLPPTKRPRRNDNASSVQNVISAIQTCVTSRDRLDAIYSACSKFDHDIQAGHDTEIAMGADIALFKHLPLLIIKKQKILFALNHNKTEEEKEEHSKNNNLHQLQKQQQYNDEYVAIIEEISNTFTALEMVLRCSAESISTCYARIGGELFTFLIDIIQDLCKSLSTVIIMDESDNGNDNGNGGTNNTTSTSDGTVKGRTSSSSLISEERVIQDDDHQGGAKQQHNHNMEHQDDTSSSNQNSVGSTSSLHKAPSSSSTASTTTSTKSQIVTNNVLFASKVILRTTTKIIAHFGRVGSLTETLANTPKLLETLCAVISMPKGSGYNNEINIPLEARLNCLWIVANLACSAENMVFMARHSKITENLFETLSHPNIHEESTLCKDIDEFITLIRIRSVAVRAVLNLSWTQQNKIPFSENVDLVESILRIASHRKSPWCGSGKGVSGILLQSRRHACGTLRNLAAAPRKFKRRLCRMKNGKFLDILADIAKYDHDYEVKEKILATLFNLVSADTAKMFTDKKDLLNVIIAAATAPDEKNVGVDNNDQNNVNRSGSSNANSNNHTSSQQKGIGGCRKMAENILRSLEKALPEDDEGYDALRPALHRFDSQIAMNRSTSNLGVVVGKGGTPNFGSVSNFGNLPSMSNFSLGDINVSLSQSTLNAETV